MFVKKELTRKDGIGKVSLILLNVGCVVSLAIVVFPLLWIARYDYPSADDWSFGMRGNHALKAGGGLFDVLVAAVKSAKDAYLTSDGRFGNDFIDSLQPGIWGEKYYALTPWILIGMLIVSEMVLFRFVIRYSARNRGPNWLWVPASAPMLVIQILYTPSPVESFYWYTGAMNYSFNYGLSLILMVLFFKLGTRRYGSRLQRILLSIAAFVIAIFIGGGNFSTSLSTLLSACLIILLFLLQKDSGFLRRTWFIPLVIAASFVVCLLSPGMMKANAFRMTEMGNPMFAVWKSLSSSAWVLFRWTQNKAVLLMLAFVAPFLWKAAENMVFSFKYPLLFTLLTFGIYASQSMPDFYTSGHLGGYRQIVILYYSYLVWLVGNVFYWIGWWGGKLRKAKQDNGKTSAERLSGTRLLAYCGVLGIALVSVIYLDKTNISGYKAYRDWRQGLAQQYAEEWENRLKILHDEDIKEVEFQFLTYYPWTLFYLELQEDESDVTYWINDVCASYYGKTYVHISRPDDGERSKNKVDDPGSAATHKDPDYETAADTPEPEER